MKLVFILLLILVSCGKNNESGKPVLPPIQEISPYTVEEEAVRTDFINRGLELLQIHEKQMKRMFTPRTLGLIRNRLIRDNVLVSGRLIMNDRNQYTRSYQRDQQVTIYVGSEDPELNWGRFRGERGELYDRWVMHEMLLLGEIDDENFIHTDRVLGIRWGGRFVVSGI